MNLPGNLIIAPAKLTGYLVIWRARNDKSGYLARAGYNLSNWHVLQADLRRLAENSEAEPAGNNPFGEFWLVSGVLHGPNGTSLRVKTVWIQLRDAGEVRFVTLACPELTPKGA